MITSIDGMEKVVRRKTFSHITIGTSFVGSFRGQFGIWHKAGEVDLVGLPENGYMHVFNLKGKFERYESIFNYTKVTLRVVVDAIAEHPGGG